ncbi:hypothetical protein FIBSPDRAFT_790201 [Athelia psychrophila]|uniref:Protein kinase domain-containing protein n=1 Tax=Athelia psychrophila TaxID=1759441 RepID=A0A166IH20_9AGAM|nr:hypothetical protein FIBSPDRAFT_790201 [Fibularhizoctonia sp. CBS 109695]
MMCGFLNHAAEEAARAPKQDDNGTSTEHVADEADKANLIHIDSKGSAKNASELVAPVAAAPQSKSKPISSADVLKLSVLDVHCAPAHLRGGSNKRRFIFRWWPRNPDGSSLSLVGPSPAGKMAGNWLPIWGATLYDFYHIRPMPGNQHAETQTSGSRAAAAVRDVGELGCATGELEWADEEDEPVVVEPSDIGIEIERAEAAEAGSVSGKSMPPTAQTVIGCAAAADEHSDSVFRRSKYPAPWPLIPFTSEETPTIHQKLELHLLPQKLFVHDPWKLLFVNGSESQTEPEANGDEEKEEGIEEPKHKEPKKRQDAGAKWTAKKDIVRVYNLQLSKANAAFLKSGGMRAEPAKLPSVTIEAKDDGSGSGITPEIVAQVVTAPGPHVVPEGHLYISPAHKIGVGNHSVVYEAEWELPRPALVPSEFCMECLMKDVAEKMQGRHMRGEFPYETCHGASQSSAYRAGEIPKMDPSVAASICWSEQFIPAMTVLLPHPEEDHEPEQYVTRPSKFIRTRHYEGPKVELDLDVKWQITASGKSCAHLTAPAQELHTAKVRVAAKLSLEHDRHLGREAEQYQSFPQHLSEHWSGYNILPPLQNPVPLSAVVPQFYGYYVPATQTESSGTKVPYLSPIMLLENCGNPVDPETLDEDDMEECSSLIHRLHEAGYAHNSIAARNIVVQPGPLSELPEKRGRDGTKSFRLIDFGRTERMESSRERRGEERETQILFHSGPSKR